mmetsp:Transcript_66739/g.186049  ORF Transcript_66739/g.186049 Transcript_66739/m.186049 type:complete len:201 (-) Transcript_66739:1227-1829(-)
MGIPAWTRHRRWCGRFPCLPAATSRPACLRRPRPQEFHPWCPRGASAQSACQPIMAATGRGRDIRPLSSSPTCRLSRRPTVRRCCLQAHRRAEGHHPKWFPTRRERLERRAGSVSLTSSRMARQRRHPAGGARHGQGQQCRWCPVTAAPRGRGPLRESNWSVGRRARRCLDTRILAPLRPPWRHATHLIAPVAAVTCPAA